MSTLEVKGIQAPSGYKLAMPAGHILQTVSTSTASSIVIASTSFVYTGLATSITPTSTDNKILVILSGGAITCNNQGRILTTAIYRDATILTNSQTIHSSPYDPFWSVHSITYLDSPSSTSAISYKAYAKQTNGSVYFNTAPGGISLTLMEVSG